MAKEKHWQKLGMELEGAWKQDYRELLKWSPRVDTKTDGSVRIPLTSPRGSYKSVGEVTVGPYSSLSGALKALDVCYPDRVDNSCGFHVHVSMTEDKVQRLLAPAFLTHVKTFWRGWGTKAGLGPKHTFWSRLAGRNQYCRVNSSFERDDPFNGSRYRQINFTSWREHGTVEVRLLPMFDSKDLGKEALKGVVKMFSSYLDDPSTEEGRLPVVWPLPSKRESDKYTQEQAKRKKERYLREIGALPALPAPPPAPHPISFGGTRGQDYPGWYWCNCGTWHRPSVGLED